MRRDRQAITRLKGDLRWEEATGRRGSREDEVRPTGLQATDVVVDLDGRAELERDPRVAHDVVALHEQQGRPVDLLEQSGKVIEWLTRKRAERDSRSGAGRSPAPRSRAD